MSIIYSGQNYADTQATPLELIDEPEYAGKIKTMFDQFVLTADLAAGDTILMGGLLPEGSMLLDCIITSQALGSSCTLNVGWQASAAQSPPGYGSEVAQPTGFFSALPVSSATVAAAHGSSYEGMASSQSIFYGYVLSAPVQPVIAENAVSSGATGKLIQMEVRYAVVQ